METGRDNGRCGTSSGVDVALLLAGGAGRRMGIDKRLLTLDGRPLVFRAIDFLRQRFAQIVVSVSERHPLDLGDERANVAVVADASGYGSPLAGLVSGLRAVDEPLLAMAADLPFPDDRVLSQLLEAWDPSIDICMPSVGKHFEPLFALYHPRALTALERVLASGHHRIATAFPELNVVRIPFADATAFTNVNTMNDYLRVRRAADADCRPFPGPAAMGRPALVTLVDADAAALAGAAAAEAARRLVPELVRLGLCVGAVEHDERSRIGGDVSAYGHADPDAAGAVAHIAADEHHLTFSIELEHGLPLPDITRRLCSGCDLVVASGYPHPPGSRIAILSGEGYPRERPLTEAALAVVTDRPVDHPHVFRSDDPAGLAAFLVVRLQTLRRS